MGWTCPAIFFRTKRMDSLLVVGILRMTYLKRIKVNNHFKTCFHNHAILHLISTLSTIETIMYTYIYIYVPGSRFATTPPPVAGKNWVYFAFCPKLLFQARCWKCCHNSTTTTTISFSATLVIPRRLSMTLSSRLHNHLVLAWFLPESWSFFHPALLHASPISLPLSNWNIVPLASHSHVRSRAISLRLLLSETFAYWIGPVCSMDESRPFRSSLDTNVITGRGLCKVWTKAVPSTALWTRTLSQVWACVKYGRRQSLPQHFEHERYHRFGLV